MSSERDLKGLIMRRGVTVLKFPMGEVLHTILGVWPLCKAMWDVSALFYVVTNKLIVVKQQKADSDGSLNLSTLVLQALKEHL